MTRAPKSPSSPSHSLEQCMSMASTLYDAYGNAQFGATEIATVAGMSVSSGTFKGWLSDLKQFGLLEKTDKSNYVIAQRFKDYLFAKDSEPAKAKSMRLEYLEIPPFFESLLASLRGRLPELNNLTSLLITQHGFNKNKATVTAKAFSESLQWAGVVDSRRNIVLGRQGVFKPNEETDKTFSVQDAGQAEEIIDAPLGPECSAKDLSSVNLSMQISLNNGRVATIKYPSDMTSDEAEKLVQVLRALTMNIEE